MVYIKIKTNKSLYPLAVLKGNENGNPECGVPGLATSKYIFVIMPPEIVTYRQNILKYIGLYFVLLSKFVHCRDVYWNRF